MMSITTYVKLSFALVKEYSDLKKYSTSFELFNFFFFEPCSLMDFFDMLP